MASNFIFRRIHSRRKDHRQPAADIKLSKFLSYICRHGAEKDRIGFLSGGFVPVWAILSHPGGRDYSEKDVRRVVATCPLSRFTLIEDSGQLLIRANSGHSFQQVDKDNIQFIPVRRVEDAPTVVYGTSKEAWKEIRANGGLSIRNKYIHFATRLCMPGDQDTGLKSDTKTDSEVYIFIDVKRALNDGIRFQRSTDGVVRCPGNEYRVLPAEYFCEVRVAEERLPLHPYNILLYFTWYPGISERHHNYCKSMCVCPSAMH